MRRTKLYIAISLNGKIAKPDGSVHWLESLPNPEKTDYGYASFYASIDTTIQGRNTYNQVMSWGIDFPYKGKLNYVFTSHKGLKDTEDVRFISENHSDFVRQLKKEDGKDIWIIGGGGLNTKLLDEGLIDEIQIFVMPIILSEGIDLFNTLLKDTTLSLLSSKPYTSGAMELKYAVV